MTDVKENNFKKDLKDTLLLNLRTDVKDWSMFSDLKNWHIKDWYILNTDDIEILRTDIHFTTSKTDILKTDLYAALIKEGYKRLIHSKIGSRTDLTKVLPNI